VSDEQDYQDYLDYQEYLKYKGSASSTPEPEGPSPLDEALDFAGRAGFGVLQGGNDIASSITGALKYASEADPFYYNMPLVGPALKALGTDTGRAMVDDANTIVQDNTEFADQYANSISSDYGDNLAGGITRGLTNFLPIMAGPTRGAMSLMGGAMSGARQYGDLRDQGIPEDLAGKSSLIRGAIDVPATYLSLLGASPTASLPAQIAVGGIGGVAGGITSNYGAQKSMEPITGEPVDLNKAATDGILEQALIGGAFPVASKALGGALSTMRNRVADAPEMDPIIQEWVDTAQPKELVTKEPQILDGTKLAETTQPAPLTEQIKPELDVPEQNLQSVLTEDLAAPATTTIADIPAPPKTPEERVVDISDTIQKVETGAPGSAGELITKGAESQKANSPTYGGTDSPMERFFQGEVFGMDLGAASAGLSKMRKGLQWASTMQQKFGIPTWDATEARLTRASSVAFDLAEVSKPFMQLNSPERLNAAIVKIKDITSDAQSKGLVVPKIDDALLQKLGLSEQEIGAFKSFRQATELAAEVVGEQYKRQSPPEEHAQIDEYVRQMKETFYVPRTRDAGRFVVVGKDGEGNVTHDYTFQTRKQAATKMKQLEAEGVKAKVIFASSKAAEAYPGTPFRHSGSNIVAEDALPPLQNFAKHLVEARNVKGYNTDIQRAWGGYVTDLATWAGNKEASTKFDEILANTKPGSATAEKVGTLKKELFMGQGSLTRNALALSNLWNLGGVTSSAVVNSFQNFQTTMPKAFGELFNDHGGNAVTMFPVVMTKAMAKSLGQLGEYLTNAKMLSPESRYLAEQASRQGVTNSSIVQDSGALPASAGSKTTLLDKAMFMFGAVERTNRTLAFNTAVEIGKLKGLDGDALFNYAKDFTTRTQFPSSALQKNSLTAGPVARVSTQYLNYQANMLKFIADHLSSGKPGDAATAIGSLLATGAIGGAVAAVPFAKPLMKIYQAISGEDDTKKVKELIAKVTEDPKWQDAIMYGMPTLAGFNVSGSMSLGDFDPKTDENPYMIAGKLATGPFGASVARAVTSANKNGPAGEPWMMYENMAPRAIRGLMKGVRAQEEGKLRNEKGLTVLDKPTTTEKVSMGLGFTPERFAANQRMIGQSYELKKNKEFPSQWNLRLGKALADGDKAEGLKIAKEIEEWNAKHPENKFKPSMAEIKERAKNVKLGLPIDVYGTPKKNLPELAPLVKDFKNRQSR
jgi:hypothetical protein